MAIIQSQINDGLPFLLKSFGKGSHGGKKRRHFLNVMFDVIGFLADFHQNIADPRGGLLEPGMIFVELVAHQKP